VLDSDLAAVYGVTTKRLNEQFRRNQKRFPEDFAFQLTAEEFESLRSQIATLDEGTQRDETLPDGTFGIGHGRLPSMVRSKLQMSCKRIVPLP